MTTVDYERSARKRIELEMSVLVSYTYTVQCTTFGGLYHTI